MELQKAKGIWPRNRKYRTTKGRRGKVLELRIRIRMIMPIHRRWCGWEPIEDVKWQK